MENKSQLGELVSLSTEDRVRLDGFFCQSEQPAATRFDAAVITHGLGGNFYSSRLLKYFGRVFNELGMAFVLANTRGHDNLTTTIRSGRITSLGAAYEKVSESEYDLAAWSDFLSRQGFENQLLFGHSLGAIKSIYASAFRPRPHVKAIAALSATRLNHQRLLDSAGGNDFKQMLEQAKSFVAQGRGNDLMRVTFPFATWMAADAYLEKYGPENKYDWIGFAERIELPTLLVYGERELNENPAFADLRLDLESLARSHSQFEIEVVEEADHFYSGRIQAAGEVVRNWLIDKF